MILKKELIKREIAGDIILVPVGRTMLDTNGMFAMSELGGFIWDLLPAVETEDELLIRILEEYEVEESVARADLRDFLNQLRKLDIL